MPMTATMAPYTLFILDDDSRQVRLWGVHCKAGAG